MLVFLFLAFLDELHTGIIVASDDIALPHFLSEVMQCLLLTEKKKKKNSFKGEEGGVSGEKSLFKVYLECPLLPDKS